jgi:hypothetical protein
MKMVIVAESATNLSGDCFDEMSDMAWAVLCKVQIKEALMWAELASDARKAVKELVEGGWVIKEKIQGFWWVKVA